MMQFAKQLKKGELSLNGEKVLIIKLTLLSLMMAQVQYAIAQEQVTVADLTTATLPTIHIEAMSAQDPIKSYIDYKQANVSRNGLDKKDIPQSIDTIDVQKYKIYGSNDLSVMLQGTPGIDSSYDMRGDGIKIRGFSADSSDIYRDGVRESGQVRRSTANVERIEILKGPASVLYGRSDGGGVINMVSKFANFESKSSVGLFSGSYGEFGTLLDLNQRVADRWAVRLTSELNQAQSFRAGISRDEIMLSPSVTYDNHDNLIWTTQYTYDRLHRIPDRGPSFDQIPLGTSRKMSFAHDSDYVNDTAQTLRTDLNYQLNPDWKLHWAASYRRADQDFDHFYLGKLCSANKPATAKDPACFKGLIQQNYFWQQTSNETTSTTLDLKGKFKTGAILHHSTVGIDYALEQREPLLSNKNLNGKQVYGYFNPTTGERSSNRESQRQLTTHSYNEANSAAFFVQDLIEFSPKYKLMLGGRYDVYKASTTERLQSSKNFGKSSSKRDQTFSPNIGFVWQPVTAQSFYASYNKSFAPFGGRTGLSVLSATQNMALFDAEPQYNEQYEIGVKSEWLDERLNTQFSIYDIRKHNIRYLADQNKPDSWTVGGEHQSRGAEFSFIGRVHDQVYVRGGYGVSHTEVKQDNNNKQLVGNRLAGTANQTGNVYVRYLPTEQWYGEIGLIHTGDSWTDKENTLKLKGVTRVDAALGYRAQPWSATLALTNLTGKDYWRSSSMPGAARSAFLKMSYEF